MKNENGQEKSAILKGQTLVNVASLYQQHYNYSDYNLSFIDKTKTYFIKFNTTFETTQIGFIVDNNTWNINIQFEATTNGYVKIKPNETKEVNRLRIRFNGNTDLSFAPTANIVCIEYQEGMENWDIPYFTGMQSVKVPVLTTTGKNLFDKSKTLENCALEGTSNVVLEGWKNYFVSDYIPVKKNEPIFIPYTGSSRKIYCDKNKEYVRQITNSDTYFTPELDGFIRLTFTNVDLNTYQLEYNTQATSYEPFKSNILSTPSDLELRGIGEVKDELDLLTGEVTENLIEFSINSESEIRGSKATIGSHTNTSRYRVNIKDTFGIDVENNYGLSDKIPYKQTDDDEFHFKIGNDKNACFIYVPKSELTTDDWGGFVEWAKNKDFKLLLKRSEKSIKTVDLTIKDQDNQPQDRMKIYPSGYIKTSSSTIPPILELKGIVHNNKLNMTTTNGVYTNNIQSLTNPILDGIICRDGTVVRDSYDVESGLYTKRVFRFTVDEGFIERYRSNFINNASDNNMYELRIDVSQINIPNSKDVVRGISTNMNYNTSISTIKVQNGRVYIRIPKEEVSSYDVNGLLEWIKRNGAIEVAYEMAKPQIIHMQPNMNPYVSTRPYQGEINSQGNALESSFLDYTQEESILSPKPLGEGDVLRWEQGSQCYVYENDKDYIPLTDYNQKVGTVLDLEDDEQFVENLDGGDIVVDVPFKEKAVYERELVSYEDTVIYPTIDKLDPDGKVEVDYICGATWQNPDDLSDIQHLGALREDGQYDVTIRRSGDDEIRFMNGTTHLSLDHEGLNPSEFELTYYNKDSVEVGKYGDTSHILENTLVDGKLETGMVYGETMVNLLNPNGLKGSTHTVEDNIVTINGNGANYTLEVTFPKIATEPNKVYTLCNCSLTDNTTSAGGNYLVTYRVTEFNGTTYKREKQINDGSMVITIGAETTNVVVSFFVRSANGEAKFTMPMLVEGDYTSYPMPIPYFEGVNSTVVNGFTTTGKNLTRGNFIGENNKKYIQLENGYILDNAISRISMLRDLSSLVPNRQYTLSFDVKFLQQSSSNRINTYLNSSVNSQTIYGSSTPNDGRLTWTFTFQDHFTFLGIYFQNDSTKGHLRAEITNIQIEEGTQATSYEPYRSIQYTLPTPITLNKVGDVADTYDVVSGVETRNYVSAKFDGSEDENWVVRFDTYGSARNKIYGAFINNMYQSGNNTYTDLFVTNYKSTQVFIDNFVGTEKGQWGVYLVGNEQEVRLITPTGTTTEQLKEYLQANPLEIVVKAKAPQKIQHTLIPSTVETMQEPTFILPQPLRSVPNGICDRLYWDENKGHYCIEKRVEQYTVDGSDDEQWKLHQNSSTGYPYYYGLYNLLRVQQINNSDSSIYFENFKSLTGIGSIDNRNSTNEGASHAWGALYLRFNSNRYPSIIDLVSFKAYFNANPMNLYYPLATPQIIDLPHLNKKLTLPTQPNTLPIGYKAVHPKMNPQIGLTIPYKQLNPPSQPQNLDFQMNKEDYVLTWNDVKEARQYNVILNDNIVATTKVPWYNTGEEIHGYILVEAQNEIADNLSKELYVKTVPKAPAQLTVAHNGLTDNYDFEISFIKSTSSLADRYTVQYRVDGGEWIIQDIPADEVDANVKVLWKFSVFEIENQIEVWATATNDMGTNDILPLSTYYMTPTPQWTYRINSREVFLRWVDESPYDTQYKLRYQYKSDGIYRYAHFEGDKEEIGKLYEAVVALAEDDEVTLELCVISDRENLYCKPIKASKALDPNILPPKNFNYRWLSRGLIEFYWEDVYDVDLEYEAIVEHRLSGEISWIEDRRVFSATDTEGTGTIYRLQYQMEDLEEIRVKVRMKWAMNETEWSESLTTVFIPVEGNPPQWIRRTQTQEGLLVEWEAQEYIDSYHVYVKGDGVELQHLETKDNFIYVDIDYSNPIDIEIYEVSRFTGGIEAEPSDSMRFIPHQNKQQMINNIYHPDSLKYEIEVDTVQKAQKASYQINDINTTPDVRTREAMDVAISSPFVISYHPLEVDVHQKGVKSYGVAETNIKTLDVKTRETVEVLTFERITDKYDMDFTVYTPSVSKYPVNLEINQVRIVCLGDSLTSGHPLYWAESGTGDVTASYPYQLAKRLKNQYEVINKGYGSDTTDRCLARFDKDVLAYSPQYCLYQCGTNDKVYVVVKSFELLGTP